MTPPQIRIEHNDDPEELEEALRRRFQGTGLEVKVIDNGTIVLEPERDSGIDEDELAMIAISIKDGEYEWVNRVRVED